MVRSQVSHEAEPRDRDHRAEERDAGARNHHRYGRQRAARCYLAAHSGQPWFGLSFFCSVLPLAGTFSVGWGDVPV